MLNEEPDYTKVRNYWKYLKAKLKKESNQLVSVTTQLKLTAADGKKYKTDMFDSDGIIELSKSFPNNKAAKFLDWFLYSDTSIDGQSNYTFITRNKNIKTLDGNTIDHRPFFPCFFQKTY